MQPERFSDRVEDAVAVEEFGIDQNGARPCGAAIGSVVSGVIGLAPKIAMAPSSLR